MSLSDCQGFQDWIRFKDFFEDGSEATCASDLAGLGGTRFSQANHISIICSFGQSGMKEGVLIPSGRKKLWRFLTFFLSIPVKMPTSNLI